MLLLLVVFPNGAWPYEAHTDASTVAIGAVLLLLQNDPEQAKKQASKKDRPHIIEYFSKALAKAQRKVSIPVLECCYAIHHHGAAQQVPPVQHLWDTTLQDLHGPLRPAVPEIKQVAIGADATLVVKKSA